MVYLKSRTCLVWFLLGVIAILVLILSSQTKRIQLNPPHIMRMTGWGGDSSPQSQVMAPIQPEDKGQQDVNVAIPALLSARGQTKDKGQQKTNRGGFEPQALPNRSTMSIEELTSELTRRRGRPATDLKVVYDQPCAVSGAVPPCVDSKCPHQLTTNPKETIEKLTMSPELTLTPDQRLAISSLGSLIPESDLIIASAVSSNHFTEMQAMFESLHKNVYPLLERRIADTKRDPILLHRENKVGLLNFTVALFDIGLSNYEKKLTEKNCRCSLVFFSKKDFPSHVHDNHCYSWKPLIMLAASGRARKMIVWQDSSVRWRESFLDNLDRAYVAGHQVLRYQEVHSIPANTQKETFDYMRQDVCGFRPYGEIQGNLHMHRADAFNRQVLFTPWARCALEKQCICPKPPMSVLACSRKSLHRCHRFDQSTMSLVLSQLYQRDLYKVLFQEFVFAQEKGFRVSRDSTNKFYFKQ